MREMADILASVSPIEGWVNSRVSPTVAIRIGDAPMAERVFAIRRSTFREYTWVKTS